MELDRNETLIMYFFYVVVFLPSVSYVVIHNYMNDGPQDILRLSYEDTLMTLETIETQAIIDLLIHNLTVLLQIGFFIYILYLLTNKLLKNFEPEEGFFSWTNVDIVIIIAVFFFAKLSYYIAWDLHMMNINNHLNIRLIFFSLFLPHGIFEVFAYGMSFLMMSRWWQRGFNKIYVGEVVYPLILIIASAIIEIEVTPFIYTLVTQL